MESVYEVEMKFSVADPAVLRERLGTVGGVFAAPRLQVDRYYSHPARDFSLTDEALRLRRDADEVAITWKGPRIDAATKTRREIELPLAPVTGGTAATLAAWDSLLTALGFIPVREVRKRRTPVHVDWRSASVEVVIDEVEGLGTFVEIEQQVAAAEVGPARDRLVALAAALACGPTERRSYLELLLAVPREDAGA